MQEWAVEAVKYLGGMPWWAAFLGFLSTAATWLFVYLSNVVRKKHLELEKERKEIENALSAVRSGGGPVVSDDQPTGRHRMPSGPEIDTTLERKWRELAEYRGTQVDALRDSLEFARRQIEELEARLKTQDQIDADLNRMTAAVAAAQREADERVRQILEQDVAPLRARVRELEEALHAATSGLSGPVTEEPPDLATDRLVTPVSGLHAALPPVRVPALPPVPGALRTIEHDEATPRPRGLPPRPVRKP